MAGDDKYKMPHLPNNLISSINLNFEEPNLDKSSPVDRKVNYFDIIVNLMKLNFIDREQVVILKKCVIRGDERVLKPLQVYNINRDLHVLIESISAIIETGN